MSIDEVECAFDKRQPLSVCDYQTRVQPTLFKIRAGEPDGRIGNIDASDVSAMLCKPHQIGSCPAPDLQDLPIGVLCERDQP